MANEITKFLKGFKAKDGNGNDVVCGLDASAIKGLPTGGSASSVEGVWVNPSNNLEINSNPSAIIPTSAGTLASDSKLNLVSANAIQIKPGKDVEKTDTINALQLDSELGGIGCKEFPVKVCNGGLDKKERVGTLKLNTSEVIFDTQNSSKIADDYEEFQIKFRYDKKDHPIYAKMKARAFDFRCLTHGGIAFQIAGKDNDGHENKIKFESDRTSGIGETPAYCGEGGKGVEFGTFNTEHASLYVGDYRFRGESMVYGVTRDALVTTSTGKRDYPKQADDFADVVDVNNGATWNDIIGVAKAWKADELGGVSEDFVKAEIAKAALEGGDVDMSVFVTKEEVEDVVISAMSEFDIDVDMSGFATEEYVNNSIKNLEDKTNLVATHIYRKSKNGNFEIDTTGLFKYAIENDATSETEDAGNATLDLISADKIALKAPAVSFEGGAIVSGLEINKNGKLLVPGNDETGKNGTLAKLNTAIGANQPKLNLRLIVDKNEFGDGGDFAANLEDVAAIRAEYPKGKVLVEVNLFDLVGLKEKVTVLESRIAELEAKMEIYHPTVNAPVEDEPVDNEEQPEVTE